MAVPAPQKILEILYGPPPAPASNNWVLGPRATTRHFQKMSCMNGLKLLHHLKNTINSR